MEQTLYYAQLDNEFFGPFALETIVDMHLTPDILVLSSGTNQWKRASEYPELIDSLDLSLYELNNNENDGDVKTEYPNEYPQTTLSFNERSVFYIRRGGNPYGPYTLEALASVPLSETTDISLDGMTSWHKLRDIPGLINALSAIANISKEYNTGEIHRSDAREEISDLLNKIKELVPPARPPYHRVFPTKKAEQGFLISEYKKIFDTLLDLIKNLSLSCGKKSLSKRVASIIASNINEAAHRINEHYLKEFERLDSSKSDFTTSSVSIGRTDYSLLPPLENVEFSRLEFLTILGDKNLYITYDKTSENRADKFINSIIAKLYENNPARLVITHVIDTEYMTGLDDSFKLLNRDLYRVISKTEEIRNILSSLQDRASAILRNLLVEKGETLQDYNSTHDNKEENILLILKDFPKGLSYDNLAALQRLSKVGPKAGIYLVILCPKERINEISEKELESFNLEEFIDLSNSFEFKNNDDEIIRTLDNGDDSELLEEHTVFDNLSETDIKQIVRNINSKCVLKENVVISISDYIPETRDWWKGESAKQIEIPFGIGSDMNIKSLKITQESGQNTAIVIGIPGSGKSVFLHSIICSAAVKYSPDELRMYLIDFSGVEFNSYALGKLPHARVIAPEAEREFGLSILNELVEEGSRRMALCRDHNVSNIVDLKRIAPEIKIPRLLVIIDEFQKLFEIENDLISREANSKIHTIIQEFRKFGINLILATQKLPSNSFLPRDLIANRIVFKSSPSDFSSLINSVGNENMPRLRTGQCVYNSESGAAYDNEKVQGFFVSNTEIDSLLTRLGEFESHQNYLRETLKVFRSGELPEFVNRRLMEHHRGIRKADCPIPIYVGESISVNEHDVNFEFHHESANNLLVIGGETSIAEGICFHALLSMSTYHETDDASIIVINGMRSDNPLAGNILATINALPFGAAFPANTAEIEMTLTAVKETIDSRRESNETAPSNIYLGFFDFQNCRAFDKDTSGRIEKSSTSSALLEYILRNGPSVGVFTILQVDNLENLARAGSVLSTFNYRVALQMPETESNKIMGSAAANKLFVFNRPASKFRAYLRDNNRNISIKFKPYKLN